MLSLKNAKKLKDAGLVWEPQEGDWCYRRYNEQWKPRLITDGIENRYTSDIFASSLSQLLAEIEGLGYWWDVSHGLVDNGVNKYRLTTSKKHNTSIPLMIFNSDTPDDAAAMALLWILEREKDGK